MLPNSKWHVVHSENGHDGFLLDYDQISPIAKTFLAKHAEVDATARL